MGFFRRRAKSEPPQPSARTTVATEPDEAFPFFDVTQGRTFRAMVRTAFAESGREVDVYADAVVDSTHGEFGLSNLAAVCHNNQGGEREWPDLIRQHVSLITRSVDAPSPFEALSRAEILASTYARIVGDDQAEIPLLSYAVPIAPGLVEVLNLDQPDTVSFYSTAHVERLGPLDELRAQGWRNLRSVTMEYHEQLTHEGGSFTVLAGESMFVASTALLLPEITHRYHEPMDERFGAFVSVPYRHQLAFHVLRDSSALASLQLMTGFAKAGFDDAPGPVSPDVYWWFEGTLRRISHLTETGVWADVQGELGEVLRALPPRPDRPDPA